MVNRDYVQRIAWGKRLRLIVILIIAFSILSCEKDGDIDSLQSGILIDVAAQYGRGICVLAGDDLCSNAIQVVQSTEMLVYVMLSNDEAVVKARKAADEAGLYGTRIFVDKIADGRIDLDDNTVDLLFYPADANIA